MTNKYYKIVFAGFIAVIALLFAVNTHYLNLQKYGQSVSIGIVLAIVALLFWSRNEWRMGRMRLPDKTAPLTEQAKIYTPTAKNIRALFSFVLLIIVVVVIWTLYLLKFEFK